MIKLADDSRIFDVQQQQLHDELAAAVQRIASGDWSNFVIEFGGSQFLIVAEVEQRRLRLMMPLAGVSDLAADQLIQLAKISDPQRTHGVVDQHWVWLQCHCEIEQASAEEMVLRIEEMSAMAEELDALCEADTGHWLGLDRPTSPYGQ